MKKNYVFILLILIIVFFYIIVYLKGEIDSHFYEHFSHYTNIE